MRINARTRAAIKFSLEQRWSNSPSGLAALVQSRVDRLALAMF